MIGNMIKLKIIHLKTAIIIITSPLTVFSRRQNKQTTDLSRWSIDPAWCCIESSSSWSFQMLTHISFPGSWPTEEDHGIWRWSLSVRISNDPHQFWIQCCLFPRPVGTYGYSIQSSLPFINIWGRGDRRDEFIFGSLILSNLAYLQNNNNGRKLW